MFTSTRPEAGTPGATAHQLVHILRQAVADPIHPGQALAIIRGLGEDRAKAALVVALVSERWTPEERNAMGSPPDPDWDSIAAENKRLRDEHARRTNSINPDEVSFEENP